MQQSKNTGLTEGDSSDSISETYQSMTTLSERNEDLESASPSPKKNKIIRNQEIN